MTDLTRIPRRERPKGRRLAESVGDYWWYVLRVAPGKEFQCQALFKRNGIVSFVPVERKWRRKNRYTKNKELMTYPLMARYVFVGFIPGIPPWFDVLSPWFVQRPVGIDGDPKRVCPKAMRYLIARYEDGLERPRQEQYMRTHKEFKAGDLVCIIDGPFEGRTVPVHDIRGREARIFLELFGAEHEVVIDTWMLEAAA